MTGWAWVRVAAWMGFLAVMIGAFGAHGLKDRLDVLNTAATYQTGVQYHMYHALALLALGAMAGPWRTGKAGAVAGWAFVYGVALFSGSLYIYSLTGFRSFAHVTPFGGVTLMVGWIALALGAARYTLFDTSEQPILSARAGAGASSGAGTDTIPSPAEGAAFDAAWQEDIEQARQP
jgi:uncharacterized membrane protein YgdD (TMEM256/DUF423 family)